MFACFSDMVSNDWRERLVLGCYDGCLLVSVTWLVMFSDMVSNVQ